LSDLQRPGADWELQFVIAGCAERRLPIEIVGSGSKRAVGRPVDGTVTITTASLRGISLYEPNELVMSARAGTPLSQVEAELAARGQMLPFEPIDLAPATGGPQGAQTIGAVFATNMSGARRIQYGAARDHLLGVRGVNGRAELFQAGGRVMKNVTGYDISRGLAGSWGTLAVMTEVTFKVIPWPETAATIIYLGLPDNLAIELLSRAMTLPVEVSGAVHLHASVAARLNHPGLKSMNKSVTALRLENFASAVAGRKQRLKEALKVYGKALELDHRETLDFWGELRRLSVMPNRQTLLWRILTKPTTAPKLVAAIKRYMPAEAYYDWAGGLPCSFAPNRASAPRSRCFSP
jgi:glycolate oxidase FAD binding subunit